MFTDEEGLTDCIHHEASIGKSDQVCLTWEMTITKVPAKSSDESKYNFWKGDYVKIVCLFVWCLTAHPHKKAISAKNRCR